MKKRNVIVSAVLTIALCVCVIAGSTYAIFTSSDQFNISATAATVKFTATTSDLTVYTELTENNVTYTNSTAEADGSILFENQGYVKFDDANDHKLVITNMTPGDGVEFKINIDNTETNVAIQYRVVLTISGELAAALSSTVSDGATTNAINILGGATTVLLSVCASFTFPSLSL